MSLIFSCFSDLNSTNTSTVDTTGLKVGISFAVLAGGLLIATLIAKLVNMCMSRRDGSVSDSKGQISDTTRDLIQTRLALIRMRQRDIEKNKSSKGPDIKGIFTQWKEKVLNKMKTKEKEKLPKNAKLVVGMDQVNENTDNKVSLQSNSVSPRLSIFEGAQNSVRKDIINGRISPKKRSLSPTKSNNSVAKEGQSNSEPNSAIKSPNGYIPNNLSPLRTSPRLSSSSPVDVNIISVGNSPTTLVTQFEEKDKESQPLDICS